MYEIILSDTAKKQLNKLNVQIQTRIGSVFERIKIRPHHFVKKLVNSPYYRLRIGEYRVILNIKENRLQILVIEIGHRKNIYKKL